MNYKFNDKSFEIVFADIFYNDGINVVNNEINNRRFIDLKAVKKFYSMNRDIEEVLLGDFSKLWMNFYNHLEVLAKAAEVNDKQTCHVDLSVFKPIHDTLRDYKFDLLNGSHAKFLFRLVPRSDLDNVFNEKEKSLLFYSFTEEKKKEFINGTLKRNVFNNDVDINFLKEWTKNFKKYRDSSKPQNVKELSNFIKSVFYGERKKKTFLKIVAPFLFDCLVNNKAKEQEFNDVYKDCKDVAISCRNLDLLPYLEGLHDKYLKSMSIKSKKDPVSLIAGESFSKYIKVDKELIILGLIPGSTEKSIENFEKTVIEFMINPSNFSVDSKLTFNLNSTKSQVVFQIDFKNFEESLGDLKKVDDFIKKVINGLMFENLKSFNNYSEINILNALDIERMHKNKNKVNEILSTPASSVSLEDLPCDTDERNTTSFKI